MKKRLFKKGGFSLVEIVVAFAIFAIFASIIAQIINLTVSRHEQNRNYQESLTAEEKKLTQDKGVVEYDATKKADKPLTLNFDGVSGDLKINYMLVNADGEGGNAGGLNYFVGEFSDVYEGDVEIKKPGGGGTSDNLAGTPITSRFDTRLTGIRGLNYIQVSECTKKNDKTYHLTTMCNTDGLSSENAKYVTYTLYFPKNVASVKADSADGVNVYRSGEKGVKVCVGNTSDKIVKSGVPVSFTVEFATPPGELGIDSFGDNAADGVYKTYQGYGGIYGAYSLEDKS